MREYNRRWGTTKDLYEHINLIQMSHGKFHNGPFYYVCPIRNIICKVIPKVVHIERSPEFWRRHYLFLHKRRIQRKQWKKDRQLGENLIKMINNPEVLKFYGNLVNQYKGMLGERERLLEGLYRSIKGTKGRRDMWARYYQNQLDRYDKNYLKTAMEIEKLKYQIEELEAGHFNSYFESNVYLYSLQKECHHFAQP